MDGLLYGLVLSRRGEGISGALVSAGKGHDEPLRAITQKTGHFVISGLKEGSYYVTIDAIGYCIKMARVDVRQRPYTIVLEHLDILED